MKSALLVPFLLVLAGCVTDDARERFIQAVQNPHAQPAWNPAIPEYETMVDRPVSDDEWTVYFTPHGTYTNFGNGYVYGPDGLYIPY